MNTLQQAAGASLPTAISQYEQTQLSQQTLYSVISQQSKMMFGQLLKVSAIAQTSLKTRFGQIELRPEQIMTMSSPIIGFEKLHQFVVFPSLDCPPLLWLQSTEDADVAFPVLDPVLVFPDYKPELPTISGEVPAKILCIVCQEAQQLGLNLLAPIVIDHSGRNAAQVVLQQAGLSTFRALET